MWSAAQVALERVIRDLIEQDADPAAGADIPRVKIDVGRFFDHQRLQAVRHRHPQRQPAIVAVVLGKHREAALALLDEKAGRAVRHLLERAGKCGADAADPIHLSFRFRPLRRPVAASRVVSCRARNFAIRSIRWTGTGSDNGNLSVPLLRSYGDSSLANASTNASLAG